MINYNFDINKIENNLRDKFLRLKEIIKSKESAVIAFSGGVDSTLLATVAFDVLRNNCIAITAISSTYPKRELEDAKILANLIGIKFDTIHSEELDIIGFNKNSVNRCYYCKKELYLKLLEYAKTNNYKSVFDGSNLSDDSDYRPGQFALKELNIVSPLKEAFLTKQEIRILSSFYNLPTKDKPSFACLASRIPYNEEITREKLEKIEKAEDYLYSLGFRQIRVRHHNNIARIEVEENQFELILKEKENIINYFKELGFVYVTLDLQGYRTGSMNIF